MSTLRLWSFLAVFAILVGGCGEETTKKHGVADATDGQELAGDDDVGVDSNIADARSDDSGRDSGAADSGEDSGPADTGVQDTGAADVAGDAADDLGDSDTAAEDSVGDAAQDTVADSTAPADSDNDGSPDSDDCAPNDPLVYPEAADPWGDGIDANCDQVDGVIPQTGDGVFVATWGADTNPGTPDEPLLTVTAGVAKAKGTGQTVFIAEGQYDEAVVVEANLHGGYEDHTWIPSPALHPTVISWDQVGTATLTVPLGATVQLTDLAPGGAMEALNVAGSASTLRLRSNTTGSGATASTIYVDSGALELVDAALTTATGNTILVVHAGTATIAGSTITHPTGDYGVFVRLQGHVSVSDSTVIAKMPIRVSEGTAELRRVTAAGIYSAFEQDFGSATISACTLTASGDLDGRSAVDMGGTAQLVLDRSLVVSTYNGAVDGGADAVITNNVLKGGNSSWTTGAVAMSAGVLAHNVISIEHASMLVAVVIVRPSGGTIIVNNVLRPGSTEILQTGLLLGSGANVTLENNLLWGTSTCDVYFDTTYGCIGIAALNDCANWDSGCTRSTGNFAGDPLFLDWDNHVVQLGTGSPCIDAGIDPSAYFADPTVVQQDFYGAPRPNGGWDIGPAEKQ